MYLFSRPLYLLTYRLTPTGWRRRFFPHAPQQHLDEHGHLSAYRSQVFGPEGAATSFCST